MDVNAKLNRENALCRNQIRKLHDQLQIATADLEQYKDYLNGIDLCRSKLLLKNILRP